MSCSTVDITIMVHRPSYLHQLHHVRAFDLVWMDWLLGYDKLIRPGLLRLSIACAFTGVSIDAPNWTRGCANESEYMAAPQL